jgi:hypothetical protein
VISDNWYAINSIAGGADDALASPGYTCESSYSFNLGNGNQVHSAVTYQVHVIEAGKVNAHAVSVKFASGQLPFLG